MEEGKKILLLLKTRTTIKALASRLGYHPISVTKMIMGEIGTRENQERVRKEALRMIQEEIEEKRKELKTLEFGE
ncbi:MAG: hypothetical protein D6816_11015 [Bacteroidetes bacterium]|nr:MAG: hypothetical protein D6816_11015 [Bacteroidota bacterium]